MQPGHGRQFKGKRVLQNQGCVFSPFTLDNFAAQFLIGRAQLRGPFGNSPLEFIRCAPMRSEHASLLHANGGRVARNAQQQHLVLGWKVTALRRSECHAQFVMNSKMEGHDFDDPLTQRIRYCNRRSGQLTTETASYSLTELFSGNGWSTALRQSYQLDTRVDKRIAHARVSEIQVQYSNYRFEQYADNVIRLQSAPNSRKCLNANQVIDATLEIYRLLAMHGVCRPLIRAAPPNCRCVFEPKFSRRLFVGGAAVCNRAAVTIGAYFDFRKARAKLYIAKHWHGASELTGVKAAAPQRPHDLRHDAQHSFSVCCRSCGTDRLRGMRFRAATAASADGTTAAGNQCVFLPRAWPVARAAGSRQVRVQYLGGATERL